VLYAACIKVEEYFGANYKLKIMGLFQTLQEFRTKKYLSHNDIYKAKSHTILHNPVFSQFKEVLFYAEILLKNQDIEAEAKKNDLKTKGYLFDISQLFEVYLEKLLGRHFVEWEVNGQEELQIYKGLFYGRKMLPDLVMRNRRTDEIIVFDAKFKMMRGIKMDVDRSDFFQIHTYIQYYGSKVILGGLIYPLSENLKNKKSVSESLFGNDGNDVQFAIDGIYVNKNMTSSELLESENNFLQRIENLIEVSRN
jgi:5-methylcytosine-specific restriction endonuclease McrBC regulatory subunit McrC